MSRPLPPTDLEQRRAFAASDPGRARVTAIEDALASGTVTRADRRALVDERETLIARNGFAWEPRLAAVAHAPIHGLYAVNEISFERGFVSHVGARANYLNDLDALAASGCHSLTLAQVEAVHFDRLLASPLLPRLRRLDLRFMPGFAAERVLELLRSPQLGALERLGLDNVAITPALAQAIAAQPSLRSLRLESTPGAGSLGAAVGQLGALENLRELELGGQDFDAKGLAALLAAPFIAKLERLAITHHKLGARGCKLLADAGFEAQLDGMSVTLSAQDHALLDAITAAIERARAARGDVAPELLAAIFEDPQNLERRQIYADYLLSTGDPRGEFIALQLADDRGELRRSGRARARALLAESGDAWLGGLARVLVRGRTQLRAGFLSVARIKQNALRVEALVDDPTWATVETLERAPLALVRAPILRASIDHLGRHPARDRNPRPRRPAANSNGRAPRRRGPQLAAAADQRLGLRRRAASRDRARRHVPGPARREPRHRARPRSRRARLAVDGPARRAAEQHRRAARGRRTDRARALRPEPRGDPERRPADDAGRAESSDSSSIHAGRGRVVAALAQPRRRTRERSISPASCGCSPTSTDSSSARRRSAASTIWPSAPRRCW